MTLTVDLADLGRCGEAMTSCQSSLDSIRVALKEIRNQMNDSLLEKNGISIQTAQLISRMEKDVVRLSKMKNGLDKIKNIYADAEKCALDLAGGCRASGGTKTTGGAGASASAEASDDGYDWMKGIFKLVGSFGVVGAVVKTGYYGASGQKWTDIAKCGTDVIASGASAAKDMIGGSGIGALFGVGKAVGAKGFAANFGKQLDKFSFATDASMTTGQKVLTKISAGAKWAGAILTVGGKFIGNVDEYNGDYSNARLYAETIGESAISIGGTMLVGAAIGAVAGATAPAWLVAAGAVVVCEGANYIVESLCGKDIPELVSDAVIDAYEYVADNAGKVIDAIGDGLDKAGRAIGKGIKSAGRAVASWFGW